MTELSIAQAVFATEHLRARSHDFAEEWLAAAASMCRAFGQPPVGVEVPAAVFAQPFENNRVAVVQVTGTPLRFRFLVLSRHLYNALHDPFAIAERFPPNWDAAGSLPELEWPPEPLPPRTIAQLDDVLKHGDGPFLLGASQALVDSGKILLQRSAPEPKLIRDLWALLPHSTRRAIWPATFAFSLELGFDLLAMPVVPEGDIPGYLSEEQARDYPDSRYERNLQIAIESGDQRMLDRLLARRSSAETLRLALLIVVLSFGIMGIVKALTLLRVI
jgi:hypothetical protein